MSAMWSYRTKAFRVTLWIVDALIAVGVVFLLISTNSEGQHNWTAAIIGTIGVVVITGSQVFVARRETVRNPIDPTT